MRRSIMLVGGVLALLVAFGTMGNAQARAFPSIIALPDGFRPEGVVTGRGPVLYAGSLANGAIYQVDPRTGEGSVLVPGQEGRIAVGLGFDPRTNYIYVAGGTTGSAFVYDADTGATVATYQLGAAGSSFVNDVVVTKDAAYFTDSSQPVLYRVPLGKGGQPAPQDAAATLPLGGEFQFVPNAFNANGIEASQNGKYLIVVNSTTGMLYRVDPESGQATAIDLGDVALTRGDGILLQGRTLYVVRNSLNQIAVVRLSGDLLSGTVTGTITDPSFDVPTTIADFGNALYAVNARFGTPPTPDTEYTIVRVPRRGQN